METYFAPAERADDRELDFDISTASESPLINQLLSVSGGLIAVLNSYRQIVSINHTLLDMMGITDPEQALGLRPGEFLHCIHARRMAGGCGTSLQCESCGAAVAIVCSLENNTTCEQRCILTVEKDNQMQDLVFSVRACPITMNEKRYILVFLNDITEQHNLAMINRVFFHDLRNIMAGLVMASDLIQRDGTERNIDLLPQMHRLINQLRQEIKIQDFFSNNQYSEYIPEKTQIHCREIIRYLKQFFQSHPSGRKKQLEFPDAIPDITLVADSTFLFRVLTNMLINAFEATAPGDFMKVSIETPPNSVRFAVWNRKSIPEKFQPRIFQRNFSTKPQAGRGIGTYSIKLIGEQFLGGKVGFTSSEESGTEFYFTVPLEQK